MNKALLIQTIRKKYAGIQPVLHERVRRIWAAEEAQQLGWGGIQMVEEATGMSHTTNRRGLRELKSAPVEQLPQHRARFPGGGRKKRKQFTPTSTRNLTLWSIRSLAAIPNRP
jgi:hypothetical protein